MLVHHVPRQLSDDNGVKIFTGQGVEKTNDVVRAIYHRNCNKHDACKDSLLALKRLFNSMKRCQINTRNMTMNIGRKGSSSKGESVHV